MKSREELEIAPRASAKLQFQCLELTRNSASFRFQFNERDTVMKRPIFFTTREAMTIFERVSKKSHTESHTREKTVEEKML